MTKKQREELEALLHAERMEKRAEKKRLLAQAQLIKDAMTVEEKIAFVNTPYKDLPDALKVGMTKNPQLFNFVHVSKPHLGRQKETFAARIIRFRDKYHLSTSEFCDYCNEVAQDYDLPAENGKRAQRTRITIRDMMAYENRNVCPKIDKMTIIAKAMGIDIDYFAGYGVTERRSKNPDIESRKAG